MTVPGQEHWVACWAVCLAAAWLVPRDGHAQASPSPAPAPPVRAAITLLGPAPEVAAVQEVTTELLARERVEISWATRASFAPQDIFERGPATDDATIAVWIDLSEPEQARLYFRHSRADRFFLRSLLLPQGIDEMAKEEIAHIVANAVLALGKGAGDALTRTEARTALQVAPAPAAARVAPAGRAVQGSVSLLIGGLRLAGDLPLVTQASALLAVTHRLPGAHTSALGGWGSFGYYQLDAEIHAGLLGMELRGMALRAGLLWTNDLSRRLALRLAVGGGADRIYYVPHVQGIVPAPADSFYVPALSFWAGLDVRLVGGLALTVHLCADAMLEKVHFDIHDIQGSGPPFRVFELDTFRPAAGVGLAYAF